MTIRFNGQDYESREAMPADVRDAFDAAMRLAAGSAPGVHATVRTTTRVTYNGVQYDDVAELPPQAQEALEQALAQLHAQATTSGGATSPTAAPAANPLWPGLQATTSDAGPRVTTEIRTTGPGSRRARPAGYAERRRVSRDEVGAAIFLVGALLLLVGAARHLSWSADPGRLVLDGALAAVAAALLLLPLIGRRREDAAGRWLLRIVYLIALAALGVTGAVTANERVGAAPAALRALPVLNKAELRGSRGSSSWQVTLSDNGRPWHVRVDEALWRRIRVGETRHGRVREGGLRVTYLVDGKLW